MHTISFNFRMFAFLLCLLIVDGCHSRDNAETTDGNVAKSGLARDTNPQVSDADLAAVAGGNTDFALKAFDQIGTDADTNTVFSPYSIYISSVVHQAFISVDEKGTEAAAATAVIIGTTASAPPPALLLTIDHPVLFFVRDRETGLILFMGKVVSL